MSRFNFHLTAMAAAAAMLPPALAADDLWLNDGGRLSGTVRTIQPDGALLLDTPLSPEPLALKPGAVKRVEFDNQKDAAIDGDCLLSLANGDSLPGTLKRIDETTVILAAGMAGHLEIPRAAVGAIKPGLNHARSVYSGPGAIGDWTLTGRNADNCTPEDGALRFRGSYVGAGREVELPEQFSLRFKLSWAGEPNMKIAFAADGPQDTEAQNRYYMVFNSAGVEIKRETVGDGQRYQSLASSASRKPEDFPGKQVLVEIVVDRKTKRLHLYLNGDSEGASVDPLPKVPAGKWIAFFSSAPDNSHCDVSDIQIGEWNQALRRDAGGDRGDKSKDALVGTDGERFTGRLLGAAKGAAGMTFSFRDEAADAPVDVPVEALSAIYLAEAGKNGGGGDISLRLRGGGLLRVTECAVTPEEVHATHPLLGKIKLKRAAVGTIETKKPQPKGEQES